MTKNVSMAVPYRLSAKVPYPILNFQYADDTIIIASAKGHTIRLLVLAVHCFSAASGFMVNFQKSSFVPMAIHHSLLPSIERLLRCKKQSLPITYLGMPLTIKTLNRMDYAPMLDRLEKRLQGWKAKFISRAGRLQLIRAVLLTIPIYFMSCFRLPKWLLQRIDAMARQFLWTAGGQNRGVNLINWQTVCLPKKCGGMGVVNLRLQNMALLLRWLWRLYAQHRMLWATYASMICTVRPIPDGPLILSVAGSFFWKILLSLRTLFHSSTKFQALSGRRISFWYDNWCGQPLALTVPRVPPHRNISLREAKQNVHTLLPGPLTFDQHRATQALTGFMPSRGSDTLNWTLTTSQKFSVKSMYKLLSMGGKEHSETYFLWRAAVTPSMQVFFFLFLKNRLLTHEVMHRRNIPYQQGCVMCDGRHIETAMHLFFTCPFADRIWSNVLTLSAYPPLVISDSLSSTFLKSFPQRRDSRKKWMTLFITTTWLLWRERNERTFRDKKSPVHVLVNRIRQEAQICSAYCSMANRAVRQN